MNYNRRRPHICIAAAYATILCMIITIANITLYILTHELPYLIASLASNVICAWAATESITSNNNRKHQQK